MLNHSNVAALVPDSFTDSRFRVAQAVIVGQARQHGRRKISDRYGSWAWRERAGNRGENGIHKYIAVIFRGVPNPHEWSNGTDLTVAGESWTDAENRIAVADDSSVADVNGAAQIQRIARALDSYVRDDVLRAIDQQGFGLAEVVVVQSEVRHFDAGRFVDRKSAETVWPRLRRIETHCYCHSLPEPCRGPHRGK